MDAKATGKDIILAIVDNMRASQEPLLYSTLVASHYDVYLHRDDYERLAAVFPRVREEAARALKEELDRVQGKGRSFLPGLKPGGPKPEPVESQWNIKFHTDEDEDLNPGDILVDSRLTMPLQPEYGTGSKTQRMVTVRSGGETKRLRSYDETGPQAPAIRPIARLTYLDKEGRKQEYLMTSSEIAIGRGGRNEFCDLQVDGPVDISRQHFYLRRDEETREFFIQDVSRFGTMVDGKKLAQREWVPIPAKARIKLADKVVIEFECL
jgi:hypothetical protein